MTGMAELQGTRAYSERPMESNIVIDCRLDKLYYGDFLAVRDSRVPIEKGKITGLHRAFGLRQEHRAAEPEPDERSRSAASVSRAT